MLALQELTSDQDDLRQQTRALIPKIKLKLEETWELDLSLCPPMIRDKNQAKWSKIIILQYVLQNDLVSLPIGPLWDVGAVLTDPKQWWQHRLTKYAKRFPELLTSMQALSAKPTNFDSDIKEALEKPPNLGLGVDIVPEIQRHELQVWKSLALIQSSEFDRMVEHGVPVAHNQEGQISIF